MFSISLPNERAEPKQRGRPITHGHASLDVTASEPDCPILRQIDDALITLRGEHRRAMRILDLGCNEGAWLIRAVLHARMLGFVAIEGCGLDVAPAKIALARRTAATVSDVRIGLAFKAANIADALAEEDDRAADIVLVHYDMFTGLPLADHERVVAELVRVTAGTLIWAGGAQ